MLRARYPILYVESFEESRVLEEIHATASDEASMRTTRPMWIWSQSTGLKDPDGKIQNGTEEPRRALQWIARQTDPGVFIFLDLHHYLGNEQRPPDPAVIRLIRDIAANFQSGSSARALILVSPVRQIPIELQKDITLLDFPLPKEVEIRNVLDDMIQANSGRIQVQIDEMGLEKMAKAARGLTLNEASNAFARAMVDDGRLTGDDVQLVLDEKRQTIRKSNILEYVDVQLDLDDVGGLHNLKNWLARRKNSWLAEAASYGLPSPKGIMITGVPGCGKSLTAKAVAAAWSLPLLRMDIGKVFAGIVGSSEQNMRSAISTAEATSPCVLWIDEIEKGFSGISGSGDSGTSSRVFGSFLTWMQEKTSAVFVIATANNVDRLPPEFLRKGRFDEVFFVDLPTTTERAQIWQLHLEKRVGERARDSRTPLGPELASKMANLSEGYSGAEIEQCVIAALFEAYSERRKLTQEDLKHALEQMVPLSVTQAEQIQAIRAWAASRAVAASAKTDLEGYEPPRALGTPPAPEAPFGPNQDSNYGQEAVRGGRMVDF